MLRHFLAKGDVGIPIMGDALFGGPLFVGILFYLGYKRCTPILRNAHNMCVFKALAGFGVKV